MKAAAPLPLLFNHKDMKRKEQSNIIRGFKARIRPTQNERAYIDFVMDVTTMIYNDCVGFFYDYRRYVMEHPLLLENEFEHRINEETNEREPIHWYHKKYNNKDWIVPNRWVSNVFRNAFVKRVLLGRYAADEDISYIDEIGPLSRYNDKGPKDRIDNLPPKYPFLGRSYKKGHKRAFPISMSLISEMVSNDFGRAVEMSNKKGGRFPKRKGRLKHQKRYSPSFTVQGEEVRIDGKNLSLTYPIADPALKDIRLYQAKDVIPDNVGKILRVTFTKDKLDEYYVSITYELAEAYPDHVQKGYIIGLDMGVRDWIAIGGQEQFIKFIRQPNRLKRLEVMKARCERNLSRKREAAKKKGVKFYESKRYQAELRRLNKYWKDIKNLRQDAINRAVNEIVSMQVSIVRVEALKIKNMTASVESEQDPETGKWKHRAPKRGLNRAILSNSWGMFLTRLEQKCKEKGILFEKVRAQNSSKRCHKCDFVHKELKAQKVWTCPNCFAVLDRDKNSCINIARANPANPDKNKKIGGFQTELF